MIAKEVSTEAIINALRFLIILISVIAMAKSCAVNQFKGAP